jgi:plasmid stability protein
MHSLVASHIMPRTTIDLDPSVLRELRRRGAREHKSMGAVASELLARALNEDGAPAPPPLRWTSAELGAPRVDLEDKEALRAILDARP